MRLKILKYPDVRLKLVSDPVVLDKIPSGSVQRLIDDMIETMYEANGVGLAAPQVGEHVRIFVIDVDDDLRVCINPEIIKRQGSLVWNEGCLSFPGLRRKKKRSNTVVLKAFDRFGKSFELEASGKKAVAIQHELDHLNGKLMNE